MMAKRWTDRHDYYQKAVRQLTTGLVNYRNLNELEKDDIIQQFEFTFELAWKTVQDYFVQEAGYADVKEPRTVLKQAIQDGLLLNGYDWLRMLESRNELTHVYDEAESHQILSDIVRVYLALLHTLDMTLTAKR